MFKKIKIILQMIKFEHTIFVLPFAYFGAMLGGIDQGQLPTLTQLGWITLAMIGARSAAMALNRLIDSNIDGKNPRTAKRELPMGKLSVLFVLAFIIISFMLLVLAALNLHPIVVKLLPLALFCLIFYSYTKRFTWSCHLILGATTAIGPLGGWLAITGYIDIIAIILFLTVCFWIAGFDILYSCQDLSFDKEEGLHSIPVRFGIDTALQIAKGFHIITVLGLLSLLFLTPLNIYFGLGVALALALLFYQHRIVRPDDLSRLNTAFFTLNGAISLIILIFFLLDIRL